MTSTSPPSIDDLLTHASFVRAVARAAVRGDHDVDDVVQTTWLAALEKGPRHGGSPRGWLATVARNAARGLKRGEGRRAGREARTARPEGVPSTSNIAAKEEVRRKLLEAVLGLEEPYRAAVLLRYYEDLPPREVAKRLGVPVETARTRVKRGLAQLRARLDEDWNGDRRAWAVAVAPLAGAGLAGTAQAAGAGLLAKAAAGVLAIGLLGGGAWYAIDWAKTAPVEPDPVEVASGDEADGGPVLRPAADTVARGRGTIRGTVRLDDGEGEVRVSAAYVGPLELLDQRRMMANPFRSLMSPPLGGDVVRQAVADADGRFYLGGLAKGLYLVAARAEDGRGRVAPAFLLADGAEGTAALDLRRGPHALTGHVLNADGTPAEGWVYLQRLSKGPVSGALFTWPAGTEPMRLDPDGGFRFADLHAGEATFLFVDPGVCVLRMEAVAVPAEAPLAIRLGAEARPRGRVVDAATGDGVAGVDVLLMIRLGGDGSFLMMRAQADGDGGLRLPGVDREIDAFVRAEGYSPTQAEWEAGEDAVVVRLDRNARIHGRVVDGDGRGLAGVRVRARPLGSNVGMPLDAGARTDETGAYALVDVSPGEVMVYAHGGGYTSPQLAAVEPGGFNPYAHAVEPGSSLAVDLAVVPAAAIEGRVADDRGAPLVGARVHVAGEPWPELRGPRLGVARFGAAGTETDGEGRFRIDTVLPGEHLQVVATTPDGARVESEPFALAGGAVHTVALVANAARYLDVRVVDEDGMPVTGARVFRMRRGPDGRVVRTAAGQLHGTNAFGRCRVGPLAASDLAVRVDATGYRRHEPVELTPAQRSGEAAVEIVLSRGLTIRGRVEGPTGLDLTTVTVALERDGSTRDSTTASADGSFRFELLPEGTYAVEASTAHEGHGWKGRAAVEDAAEPLRLTLERGARLHEPSPPQVEDRVTRWTIHVRGPEGEEVSQIAHREYNRFPHMPWQYAGYGRGRGPTRVQTHVAGTDELYVEVFGAQEGRGRPLPLGTALVRPGDLPAGGGEVTVTLPPEQRIQGRIVGPDGQGVAGVPLEAYADYGTHGLPIADHDPHARTRSGSDGAFTLRQLGPFAYVLRLDLPEAYAPQVDVAVHAGDDDVVIALRPSVAARIVVVDEGGRPIEGAHVQLGGARDVSVAGPTNHEGVFVAQGLAPEMRYRVTARFLEDAKRYLPITLEDQAPGPIEIVLPAAHAVAGTVVDPQGRPLAWARVHRQTSENGWETHFADASGRFAIERLTAGEHVLMVAPALPLRWFEGARHTVRAPASDLRLTASLGAGITFRLPDDVVPEEAAIVVTDQAEPARVGRFHAQMIKRHEDTIHGLDPARRYTLYAVADGRVFLATDLRPGADVVEIELAPWRTLIVHLDLPGGLPAGLGWEHVGVTAEGPGWRQHGRLVDAGGPTWEVPALPPGACTVQARLERWARPSNDPAVPPERIGARYEAVAEDVAADEVRLTLRAVAD